MATDILLPKALVDKAQQVVDANRAAGKRIAVAESCTGGLVSAAITEIAGSSDVFEAGYVTYSNAAKIADLHVSQEVVETFGAVSIATAWAMARGALQRIGCRRRRGDHRCRRSGWRYAEQAGRNGRLRAGRARQGPVTNRRGPAVLRRARPGRRAPSGGALRA